MIRIGPLGPAARVAWAMLGSWSRSHRRRAGDLAGSEQLFELPIGMVDAERYRGWLNDILRRARPGTVELVCHPGYAGREPDAIPRSGPDSELAALADPAFRDSAERRGVRWGTERTALSERGEEESHAIR